VGPWLIAGSEWMLRQDLVPALRARLCAPGVTAVERDSLDVTDRDRRLSCDNGPS
jgi:hypothetical protein